MESPEQYYLIPRSLDNGELFMGLPRAEVLPALVLSGMGFILHHELIAIGLACVVFFCVRYLRSKYGNNLFARLYFYYFSTQGSRSYFKRLPAASIRYWRY